MRTIEIYTDGAAHLDQRATFAYVLIEDGQIIHENAATVMGEIRKTNVVAELCAAMHGLREAILRCAKEEPVTLVVCHDYVGVGHWVCGTWRAKDVHTRAYALWVEQFRRNHPQVLLQFRHTPDGSHPHNVRAHKLCHALLQAQGREVKRNATLSQE